MKVGQKVVIVEDEQHFHCLAPMTIATITEVKKYGCYIQADGVGQDGVKRSQCLRPEDYELIPEDVEVE